VIRLQEYLYNRFLQSAHDGVHPRFLVFYNEAWFSLRGEVNSQNSEAGSAENSALTHEISLHDEKIGVWCAMNTRRENSTTSSQELQRVTKPYLKTVLA
jgi:hypothetical protein